MKTIKLFAAIVAIATASLFNSCEQLKSLADVDVSTNYIVDIPVDLVKADAQSASFTMTIKDIEELSEYMDVITYLTIEDVEISVLAYNGDSYSGDIELTADDQTLWSREDIIARDIDGLLLKGDGNLNEEVLNQVAMKLLNKESVKGGLNITSDSSDPITADFTVRCKFILKATANILE